MKYFIYSLLVLASCSPKEKENSISGKWEFEKNELFAGVTINDFQDSLFMMLNEQQKGLTLTFTNSSFKVTQQKNGREEVMGEQPYELTNNNQSLVLKNRGRPDDVFPIVSLSDSVLKLNMFVSKEGYLVFRRKK